jgi:hypothetical protein
LSAVRTRFTRAGWRDALTISALIALASAVYMDYALKVAQFQPDEEYFMQLARYTATHFPSAVWSSHYLRGLQRIDEIILAGPFALLKGPAVFELDHLIQCLLFASAALPIFLIARRFLGRPAASFAALLVLVVPWCVVATSFLSEPAAYPAFCWCLYATLRTLRSPSLRGDLFALATIAVAAFCRDQLFTTALLLPLAIVVYESRSAEAGGSWAAGVRGTAARVWARHRTVAAITIAGLIVLVVAALGLLPGKGLAALTGDYGLPHLASLGALWRYYRYDLSRVVVGTGIFAVALGLPWALRALLRPADRERYAVAVVCASAFIAWLLSEVSGGIDERYLVYMAAPIALTAAAALNDWARARRPSRASAIGVVLGALVVVALITIAHWPPLRSPYDYFAYSAAIFYNDVLLRGAGLVAIPGAVLALAIVAAAAAFAALGRRPGGARIGAVAMAALLALICLTQTGYTLQRFTHTAGVGVNARERSWIDFSLPAGTTVGDLAVSDGSAPAFLPVWRGTNFWNTEVGVDAYYGAQGSLPNPLGDPLVRVTIERPSGRLLGTLRSGRASAANIPRYLVVPDNHPIALGLHAQTIAASVYLPIQLDLLTGPPRADWSTTGTSNAGVVTPGRPAVTTIYAGALNGRSRCVSFSLTAPASARRSWPYSLAVNAAAVRAGTLPAGATVAFALPLPLPAPPPSSGVDTLSVAIAGSRPANAAVGVTLQGLAVGGCSAQR